MRRWSSLLPSLHFQRLPFSPHTRLPYPCRRHFTTTTTTTTTTPHAPLPDLLHHLRTIIFSEAGSLGDLELRLDHLGLSPTPFLVTAVLDSASDARFDDDNTLASRRLLRFFSWFRRNSPEDVDDSCFNRAIRAMAERRDFTAVGILIADLRCERREMDAETFALVSEALVKAGRATDALRLLRDLEGHQRRPRGEDSAARAMSIVQALCSKGQAREAEGVVRRHRDTLLGPALGPDVYRHLLHGWCCGRNAGEARRVLGEMRAAGVRPGIGSYNSFLRCVCDRNVKFNPSALTSEANDIVMEMRTSGVQPTAVSFNILLSCLGRTRRVKEACKVLDSMADGSAGCPPDWVSYYLVVRVLYLTARFVRGNRIVRQMLESNVLPGARFYHDLVGVLCGMERMDHALQMFEQMKTNCTEDNGPTYDLLIAKFCRNGEFDMGRGLWDEAVQRGVVLRCSVDLLDPLKTEVFKLRERSKAEPSKVMTARKEGKKVAVRKNLRHMRKKKI